MTNIFIEITNILNEYEKLLDEYHSKKFNIDIITSNKEFAKEYSNPKLIFNPYSSISIANKIEQYISKKITN